MLDTTILRPDQIYSFSFVSKDGTKIKRFSDESPRESQNIEKMYLNGAFDGMPKYNKLYFLINYAKIIIRLKIGEIIMALGKLKRMITEEVEDTEEEYYNADNVTLPSSGKMILLEPRAFSESQQIADHLKKKNTVVVNMKRVTPDQAKRIVDFLSGTVYAIGGDLQKIGGGIFLCTPKNVNVEGSISDDDNKGKKKEELELEWN